MAAMIAPGRARPDVLSAAWDVLGACDEVRSAGERFDELTRNGQRPVDWDAFTSWRDGRYAPAHAALAAAVATFTMLLGRVSGDAVALAERIVAADITASLTSELAVTGRAA
jgi:hypothetical protein